MGWETRGQRRVYYRSRRDGDRVIKVYYGSGERARQAAREDDEARAEREAGRRAVAREEARTATAESLTLEAEDLSTLLIEAVLLAAGYHRRNYGPWRMRRGAGQGRRARPA